VISDSFSLRVRVDEHVCHAVIQKVTMHDFPDVIMASTFYRVVYPFSGVRGNLPVLTATRTGNLPVPVHGTAVYLSLLIVEFS